MSVKVAIVGAGYAANKIHIPDWKHIKADVVAVCDINKEAAMKTAKNWGIKKIYTDFEKLLEKEKDVIIDLCAPPSINVSLSIQAMNEGFSVMMEKPMSMKIEESEKILKCYEKNKKKVKFCVVRNMLFNPLIRSIRAQLSKEREEVLCVDIHMLHTPKDPMISDKNHWCHSLPGGRFGECLIHPIYVLCDLLGEYDLKIKELEIAKRGSYDWVKYDEVFIVFTSNNKFGSIHVSFNSPITTWPLHVEVYTKNSVLTTGSINKVAKKEPNYFLRRLNKWFEHVSFLSTSTKEFLREIFYPRRERRGHIYLFKEFVEWVIKNKPMSYTPEQAFKSNELFLKILNQLP